MREAVLGRVTSTSDSLKRCAADADLHEGPRQILCLCQTCADGKKQRGPTQNAVYSSVLANINEIIFTRYSNPGPSTRTSYVWGFATRR